MVSHERKNHCTKNHPSMFVEQSLLLHSLSNNKVHRAFGEHRIIVILDIAAKVAEFNRQQLFFIFFYFFSFCVVCSRQPTAEETRAIEITDYCEGRAHPIIDTYADMNYPPVRYNTTRNPEWHKIESFNNSIWGADMTIRSGHIIDLLLRLGSAQSPDDTHTK